jgi:AF2212-like protein
MTTTLEATFDGKVLRPDTPLDLEPNTRVRVTIETREKPEKSLGVLRELFGSVDLGHPIGIDNESLDADLAREYADPHEDDR